MHISASESLASKIQVDTNRLPEILASPFGILMEITTVVAGLAHLGFLIVFFLAGLHWLAIVNIASILCYVLAYFLARRGAISKSLVLTVLEVVAHAVVTTLLIGWSSGFQYYLAFLIPIAVTSAIRSPWIKGALVVTVACIYLGLDMAVRDRPPSDLLTKEMLTGLYYFNLVAYQVLLTVIASRFFYMINRAQKALYELANSDALTHLHNRRSLMETIRTQENRIRRGHPDLSFILCDLDLFKNINDNWGHAAGDKVLRSVSETLTECLREVDIAGRWGGEEFLVILPDTNLAGAVMVAERVRSAIAAKEISVAGGQTLHVSMTLGVATIGTDESADQAIARADSALYEGKRTGRNRVMRAQAETGPISQPA